MSVSKSAPPSTLDVALPSGTENATATTSQPHQFSRVGSGRRKKSLRNNAMGVMGGLYTAQVASQNDCRAQPTPGLKVIRFRHFAASRAAKNGTQYYRDVRNPMAIVRQQRMTFADIRAQSRSLRLCNSLNSDHVLWRFANGNTQP